MGTNFCRPICQSCLDPVSEVFVELFHRTSVYLLREAKDPTIEDQINLPQQSSSMLIKKKAIFIFGGPGSKKGQVIDLLTTVYNFDVIQLENLIFEHFPVLIKKGKYKGISRTTDNASMHNISRTPSFACKQNQTLCENHAISTEWLMRILAQEILKSSKEYFLIDLLPNNTTVLNRLDVQIEHFTEEMSEFKKICVCLFALYLSVPSIHIKQMVQEFKNGIFMGNFTDVPSDQNYELLLKRHAVFLKEVDIYLKYFTMCGCLITEDVTAINSTESIVHQVEKRLLMHGFKMSRKIPQAKYMIFAENLHELKPIELPQSAILLLSFVSPPIIHQKLDTMFHQLKNYILCMPMWNDKLIIVCDGTVFLHSRPPKNMMIKKEVTFMDEKPDLKFDKYCIGSDKMTGLHQQSLSTFKSVVFPDNTACLFPFYVKTNLCKYISMNVRKLLKEKCKNSNTDLSFVIDL